MVSVPTTNGVRPSKLIKAIVPALLCPALAVGQSTLLDSTRLSETHPTGNENRTDSGSPGRRLHGS